LLLLAPVALAGCTFLEELYSGLPRESRPEPVPLEARPVEEPISRNYFVLETETQSVIGAPQIVYTDAENTFSDLAREYGLGYDELVAANPDVDPWLPGDRTPVLLPTQYIVPDVPREGIVLNIAARRLFYFPEVAEGQPQTVLTYPIGIGRVGWETPVGTTEVVSKAADPHWFPPASVRQEHAEQGDPLPAVVPPGPDNPLGNRVLQLDRYYSPEQLRRAAAHLNEQFSGRQLDEVRDRLVAQLKETREQMNQMMIDAITIADRLFASGGRQGEADVLIAGETNLMGFAELSNVEKLRKLFEAFNEKRDILHLLDQSLHAEGVQIFIGHESGYTILDDCTVITAPYARDSGSIGVLGVIGPTRLAYERVIPIVDLTARLLGMALKSGA